MAIPKGSRRWTYLSPPQRAFRLQCMLYHLPISPSKLTIHRSTNKFAPITNPPHQLNPKVALPLQTPPHPASASVLPMHYPSPRMTPIPIPTWPIRRHARESNMMLQNHPLQPPLPLPVSTYPFFLRKLGRRTRVAILPGIGFRKSWMEFGMC